MEDCIPDAYEFPGLFRFELNFVVLNIEDVSVMS